jgi:hypothetical protein
MVSETQNHKVSALPNCSPLRRITLKILLILAIAMQATAQQQATTALYLRIEPAAMLTSPASIVIPAGSMEGTFSVGYKIRTSTTGGSGMLTLTLLSAEQEGISYACLGTTAGATCSEPMTMKNIATPVLRFGSDSHSSNGGDTMTVRWHSNEPLSRDVIIALTISAT